MKSRKIFLDGFVELKPNIFRDKTSEKSGFITIQERIVHISSKAVKTLGINFDEDGNCYCRVMLSNDGRFAIIIDEDGPFIIKKINRYGFAQINNTELCSVLQKNGFTRKRHYAIKKTRIGENIFIVSLNNEE